MVNGGQWWPNFLETYKSCRKLEVAKRAGRAGTGYGLNGRWAKRARAKRAWAKRARAKWSHIIRIALEKTTPHLYLSN